MLDTCIQCGAERERPIPAEDFERETGISPDPKHRMGHYVYVGKRKKQEKRLV